MPRYCVTGANGQLGRSVLAAIARRGHTAHGAGHAEVAVEDARAVRAWIAGRAPDVVLHCAAWTDVDGCEREPQRAERINAEGTGHVAAACREIGATLVYVSTDFVFDGRGTRPYRHDDPPAPLSAYGRSKLGGERAVLAGGGERAYVVRTSWVFGPGGRNFPRAILERARSGQPLRVVDDQVGSPTMTHDLADALLDLAESQAQPGIYHAANAGSCSWHAFAVDILREAGLDGMEVARMSSAELGRPAPRPAYSVLDCSRLAAVRGRPMPSYLDALRRYLAEEAKGPR
jgi:dTDP-4-dehydrorhamnose reductase